MRKVSFAAIMSPKSLVLAIYNAKSVSGTDLPSASCTCPQTAPSSESTVKIASSPAGLEKVKAVPPGGDKGEYWDGDGDNDDGDDDYSGHHQGYDDDDDDEMCNR